MVTPVMTAKEFVNALMKAYNRPNYYNNNFPYNCGYYDGSKISWDCWNLGKTIIWSHGDIVDNYTKGKYQKVNKETNLGDWDGYAICVQGVCSRDFTDIKVGEWLYCEDHVGYYIGNGKVLEDTIAWGAKKIVISEVGSKGERTLNGVPAKTSKWEFHSQIPWIDYSESKIMTTTQRYILDAVEATVLKLGMREPEHLIKMVQAWLQYWGWYDGEIDGWYGNMSANAVKAWQKWEGRTANGEIHAIDWKQIEEGYPDA